MPPLGRHSIGDALIGTGSFRCPRRGWWHPPYPVLSAGNDIGRHQLRKPFQPQACSFGFSMPELPRLDNLIRFAVQPRHNANGIFNGYSKDGGIDYLHEKSYGCLLPAIRTFSSKVPGAADTDVRAFRMRDHTIPPVRQMLQYVPLNVPSRVAFTWLQIARPRVMPKGAEGITDNS